MSFLLYGAYGYTGTLIAEAAAEAGLRPTLSGRDPDRLSALADRLGLPHRGVSLDMPEGLQEVVRGHTCVVHAAGPFARTSLPMVNACLATRTHYLDITGEIEVFERLAAMDAVAKEAGVMLLPGAGFDVVPSDSLAAHLKRRLPEATELDLAFRGMGRVSRGTATTAIENLGRGGAMRRDGQIVSVPPAHRSRTVDFGTGPRTVTSIPWGDVSTAYYTTGIPTITTFTVVPEPFRTLLRMSPWLGWLLASTPVQALLKAWVDRQPPGPSPEERASGWSQLWGEARAPDGRTVQSRLQGPEGYSWTARTALAIAQAVERGQARPGFQTPAGLLGADFVLDMDGVRREDLDVASD